MMIDAGSVGGFDRLVVGPERRVGESGDRRDAGGGAGGDDHGTRGSVPVAVDLDDVGGEQSPAAADEGSALADEAIDRHGVVPVVGGLGADPGGDRSPVGRYGRRAGEAGDPASLGERVRSADHHLRRDAAPVRALTADQAGLDADDGQSCLDKVPGDVLATRAHARARRRRPSSRGSCRSCSYRTLPDDLAGERAGVVHQLVEATLVRQADLAVELVTVGIDHDDRGMLMML
jgi:hypothetical protein